MRPETQWWPGLIVVAVGILSALIYYLLIQRRAPAGRPAGQRSKPGAANLDDLEQRSARALDQLKELYAERHHYSEAQLQSERARLERAAADALKEEDVARQAQQRKAPASNPPTGFWSRHPRWSGALWGAGVVVFFVSLGWVLSREQAPRKDEGPMTGGDAAMEGAQSGQNQDAAAKDPELAAALKRLEAAPNNIEAINAVAHQLIRREIFDEAEKVAAQATATDPFHVETRVHRTISRASSSGDMAGARVELEKLARHYPQAYEARLYAGAIAMKLGDKAAAVDQFERYLAEAPRSEVPPMLEQSVAALRNDLGSAR